MTVLLAICIAFNIIVLLLRSCYLGYHLLCQKPERIFDDKLTDVEETESPASQHNDVNDVETQNTGLPRPINDDEKGNTNVYH